MVEKIVFYSNVSQGDLHLCRCFCKRLMEIFPEFVYFFAHDHNPYVLNELKINTIKNIAQNLPRNSEFIETNDTIYLNTWIGAGGRTMGVNFKAVEDLFNSHVKFLNSLLDTERKLGDVKISIDYNNFYIKNVDEYVKDKDFSKSILFCNNIPASGQSFSCSLENFINSISKKMEDYNFYITNKINPLINRSNVFYVEDIINSKNPSTINEISYFSLFCKIIFGRGSGPFTFSMVDENKEKKLISYTHKNLELDSFNGLYMYMGYDKPINNYLHTNCLIETEKFLNEK